MARDTAAREMRRQNGRETGRGRVATMDADQIGARAEMRRADRYLHVTWRRVMWREKRQHSSGEDDDFEVARTWPTSIGDPRLGPNLSHSRDHASDSESARHVASGDVARWPEKRQHSSGED